MPSSQEMLDWAEKWYAFSWWGISAAGAVTTLGAFATVIFIILQWRTSTIRDAETGRRMSGYETREIDTKAALETAKAGLAEASARIAQSEARAREAELNSARLRAQITARHLDQAKLVEALEGRPKMPVEILYQRDDSEGFDLASELRQGLAIAGWSAAEPVPIHCQRLRRSQACRLLWLQGAGRPE